MKYPNGNPARQVSEKDRFNVKVEQEYDSAGSETTALGPALENNWVNRIYNFEQQYKYAKRIKVYDFLGRPVFKKVDELKPEEIGSELDRMRSLMEEKGMALDCSCDYDNLIIYLFVTEELFELEIDNVSMEGMVTHFIYEEFHPNHDLDLRKYANELIEILFHKKWDKFDSHCFAGRVDFKGSEYKNGGIADIIQTFQEAHNSFSVEQFQIQDVKFDMVKEHADIQAWIRYRSRGNGNRYFEGSCKITFLYQWGYWYIDGFRLPGFGD